MMKSIALAVVLTAITVSSAKAQYATGTEKYDMVCGKNGYTCLPADALKNLVGKKTYLQTHPL